MGGSRVTAIGFTIMLLAVSTGVGSGDVGLLLGLVGVIIGSNLVFVGIHRMGEAPTTSTSPGEFAGVGAFTMFLLRRNLAVAGLIMASWAVTALANETGPVLCFGISTLFLLGISMINVGILGEYQWCRRDNFSFDQCRK